MRPARMFAKECWDLFLGNASLEDPQYALAAARFAMDYPSLIEGKNVKPMEECYYCHRTVEYDNSRQAWFAIDLDGMQRYLCLGGGPGHHMGVLREYVTRD